MSRWNSFADFEKFFSKKFSKWCKKFPLTFALIERDIRTHFVLRERHLFAKQLDGKINEVRDASIATRNFEIIKQKIEGYFLKQGSHRGYLVHSVDRAPAIEKCLMELAIENGLERLRPHQLTKTLTSGALSIGYGNKNWYISILQAIKSGEYDDIFEDQKNSLAFECYLETVVADLASKIQSLNIKIIVSHDFHSGRGSLLANACRKAGIPSVEVAHGYTTNRYWLTVWPIRADYEILWSDNLVNAARQDFSHFNSFRSVQVKTFGIPITQRNRYLPDGDKYILLLLEHFSGHSRNIENIKMVTDAGKSLLSQGYNVVFRPHPRAFQFQQISQYEDIVQSRIRNVGIEEALNNSDVVIGASSSVLVQAAVYGIPVFQIAQTHALEMPGIQKITLQNIREGQISHVPSNYYKLMDKALCKEFFQTLIMPSSEN